MRRYVPLTAADRDHAGRERGVRPRRYSSSPNDGSGVGIRLDVGAGVGRVGAGAGAGRVGAGFCGAGRAAGCFGGAFAAGRGAFAGAFFIGFLAAGFAAFPAGFFAAFFAAFFAGFPPFGFAAFFAAPRRAAAAVFDPDDRIGTSSCVDPTRASADHPERPAA